MSLPGFQASASILATSRPYRAEEAAGGPRRGADVVPAFTINRNCHTWELCCKRTGSAYCCNHYYGICVNPT